MVPKLKSVFVSGFKSLGSVTLPLEGLSVLIGNNGSGKSSLIEVLEILRITTHEGFVGRIASAHGGINQLREHEAPLVAIAAEIDDGRPDPLVYVQRWWDGAGAPQEHIVRHRGDLAALALDTEEHGLLAHRGSDTAKIRLSDGRAIALGRTDSLVFGGATHTPDVGTVASVLRGLDIKLSFQVSAAWANRERRQSPRGVSLFEPTRHLEQFGTNLVNAYQALKNEFGLDHWKETLEYIQLGLGHKIRDVRLEAIPGGGHVALSLEIMDQGRVPAFSLADGVLCYLAFVALFRLDEGRTLLAFDEPELHLHPGLLMRVLGMLETMSDQYPVVIATHSDRLLDGLSDPVRSVVVTELDARSRTRLRRLDAAALADWMTHYRGLGDLRADGELRSVLVEVAPPSGRDSEEQHRTP